MHQYNQSLSYDQRMYAADVKGSIAHSRGLEKAGILTQHEREEIERGLKEVEKEWQEGKFKIFPDDEDIHTANERRLSEIIGKDIGGKLHTGRSRNDQVATDMRIWLVSLQQQRARSRCLLTSVLDGGSREDQGIPQRFDPRHG
jgi:argininosuccinate lyase